MEVYYSSFFSWYRWCHYIDVVGVSCFSLLILVLRQFIIYYAGSLPTSAFIYSLSHQFIQYIFIVLCLLHAWNFIWC